MLEMVNTTRNKWYNGAICMFSVIYILQYYIGINMGRVSYHNKKKVCLTIHERHFQLAALACWDLGPLKVKVSVSSLKLVSGCDTLHQ